MTSRTSILWLAAAPLVLGSTFARATEPPPVSFGDDTSAWAKDGECDDPRFTGEGMAADLLVENIGRDATDCSTAWVARRLDMNRLFLPLSESPSINFGADGSAFANDGHCDDVRFVGKHTRSSIFLVEDIGQDAADCKAAFEAGTVTYQGDALHPDIGRKFV